MSSGAAENFSSIKPTRKPRLVCFFCRLYYGSHFLEQMACFFWNVVWKKCSKQTQDSIFLFFVWVGGTWYFGILLCCFSVWNFWASSEGQDIYIYEKWGLAHVVVGAVVWWCRTGKRKWKHFVTIFTYIYSASWFVLCSCPHKNKVYYKKLKYTPPMSVCVWYILWSRVRLPPGVCPH